MSKRNRLIISSIIVLLVALLLGCEGLTEENYKIEFESYGGSEITPITTDNGLSISEPIEPTKEGHTFDGWYFDEDFSDEVEWPLLIESSFTLYAKWNINNYTITWKDYEGNILGTTDEAYGSTPSYDLPILPMDTQEWEYISNSWSPKITIVTEDTIYQAVFDRIKQTYAISWTVDETTYTTLEAYGNMPQFDGGTPQKEGNAQYSYQFIGWNLEPSEVVGETTYIAQFEASINTYEVQFVISEDQSQNQTYDLLFGETPLYEGTPIKEPTAQFVYTFIGWDKHIEEVTQTETYVAQFDESLRYYTISWYDYEGVLLGITEEAYGSIPSYELPVLPENTDQWNYLTNIWSPEISTVNSDASYQAQFERELQIYVIIWIIDGVAYATSEPYGNVAQYVGETPQKEGNEQYHYQFIGWDVNPVMVTTGAIYIAQFLQSNNQYTCSFYDDDGITLISSETVDYGSAIEIPEEPFKEGFLFEGWFTSMTYLEDEAFIFDTLITTDIVLYAKWSIDTATYYDVTFDTVGGSAVTGYKRIESGSTIVAPEATTKSGYNFVAWYKDLNYTEVWDFENDLVSKNTFLYARWVVNFYTPILTALDLRNIELNGNYALMNDIDLRGYEWNPLASSETDAYTGTFNGNGYKIHNFKITGSRQYAGVFGYNIGTIMSLGVENFTINISYSKSTSALAYGGGIVGYNTGTIINSYTNGSVKISSTSTSNSISYLINASVGGISGYNSGIISKSYSKGSVEAFSSAQSINQSSTTNSGGISGINQGSIYDSYSNAIISATSYPFSTSNNGSSARAGGIAGVGGGLIVASYSTGNITAKSAQSSAGGILASDSSGDSFIERSFSTGNISATSTWTQTTVNAGSIVGSHSRPFQITGNYYSDSQRISRTLGYATNYTPSNTYGTATSIESFKNRTFMMDVLRWSTNIWIFINEEFPVLR